MKLDLKGKKVILKLNAFDLQTLSILLELAAVNEQATDNARNEASTLLRKLNVMRQCLHESKGVII